MAGSSSRRVLGGDLRHHPNAPATDAARHVPAARARTVGGLSDTRPPWWSGSTGPRSRVHDLGASAEVQAGRDLDRDGCGHDAINGQAERRPPACAGDEVGAVLPQVFEAVADV